VKKLEPIYSTYFDVEFTSVDLTDEDKQILHDCVKSVSSREITFGLYYQNDTRKIVPVDSLLKLKNSQKKSDVIISILDNDYGKKGKIIGTLIYKECNMSVDFDDLLFFTHLEENNFLQAARTKEITLNLHSSTILYNNQEI